MAFAAEKAKGFKAPPKGEWWDSNVEDAVETVQTWLGLAKTDEKSYVEVAREWGRRGAEFCQLLHRVTKHLCIEPQPKVLDMNKVFCQEKLEDDEVMANYNLLKEALITLGVEALGPENSAADCGITGEANNRAPFTSEEFLLHMRKGEYTGISDFIRWIVAFSNHLEPPEFYRPDEDREEAMRVNRPLAEVREKQRQESQKRDGSRRRGAPGWSPSPVQPRRGMIPPSPRGPVRGMPNVSNSPQMTAREIAKRRRDEPQALPAPKHPRAAQAGGKPPLPNKPRGAFVDRTVNAAPGTAAKRDATKDELIQLRASLAESKDEIKKFKDTADSERSKYNTLQIQHDAVQTKHGEILDRIRSAVSDVGGMTAEQVARAVLDRLA